MRRRIPLLILLTLLCPWRAEAHLGSPDIFFDGPAGPYSASITIRMPGVVPGHAQIFVRVRGDEPVTVGFAPIASFIAVKNAPPPEPASAVMGETNSFAGELWLMTKGAYSIDVRIRGQSGEGSVRIPVNSIPTRQLPFPKWLAGAMLALGLLLFCAGVAIVGAAAGEAVLPPEIPIGPETRRRYWTALITSAVILAVLLVGGKKWWDSEARDFRDRLVEGGWPDMEANVRLDGSQRILNLRLGHADWDNLQFAPDHGKLLHLFLVRQPSHQAFAHLHPFRVEKGNTFDVGLPPLPEGDYELFCDLTLADSGFSSTATNTVHLPAIPSVPAAARPMKTDPDDSWSIDSAGAMLDKPASDVIYRLADGGQVIWKAHPALHAQQDAGLRFEVRDNSGQPATLEPYMGMFSHAALMRSDARVFSHLHPSGNFSMAAQAFFDVKMARENGTGAKPQAGVPDVICGWNHTAGEPASITLPYQFPSAGDYRLWVQIKTGGRVQTAIFDTTVGPASL